MSRNYSSESKWVEYTTTIKEKKNYTPPPTRQLGFISKERELQDENQLVQGNQMKETKS